MCSCSLCAAFPFQNGYDHFMQKEVHEQPRTLADTMRGRLIINKPLTPTRSLGSLAASLSTLNLNALDPKSTPFASALVGAAPWGGAPSLASSASSTGIFAARADSGSSDGSRSSGGSGDGSRGSDSSSIGSASSIGAASRSSFGSIRTKKDKPAVHKPTIRLAGGSWQHQYRWQTEFADIVAGTRLCDGCAGPIALLLGEQ